MQGEYLLIMSFVVSNFFSFFTFSFMGQGLSSARGGVITEVPYINFHILGISIYQISK